METLLANFNKAIRDNEKVLIGGGIFEGHELYKIIQLYEAAKLAKQAIKLKLNGDSVEILEKQALDALKLILH